MVIFNSYVSLPGRVIYLNNSCGKPTKIVVIVTPTKPNRSDHVDHPMTQPGDVNTLRHRKWRRNVVDFPIDSMVIFHSSNHTLW